MHQIEWLTSIDAAVRRFQQLAEAARRAQVHAYAQRELPAWCAACGRKATLKLPSSPVAGEWVNLRERLVCECGMNSRMRMIFSALSERPFVERALMFERVTPLFERLRARFPFVEGCEYFGPDVSPGQMQLFQGTKVRHETLMGLSYADRTFAHLFHGDVLEHVPDMKRALSECHRVLKPGGTLLFTCPMTNLRQHIVRARVVNGELKHLLPPGYHGNPMDDQGGALVFNEPGLQLLDDIRAAGFGSAELGLAFDPEQGLLRDGNPYEDFNMWPVIFRATRLL